MKESALVPFRVEALVYYDFLHTCINVVQSSGIGISYSAEREDFPFGSSRDETPLSSHFPNTRKGSLAKMVYYLNRVH